ncbi:MAG: hypothetical protein QOE80_1350, partial [Actinomycetota bacterium]|nr:hypothetical protein [Actinomycetota bacterium]
MRAPAGVLALVIASLATHAPISSRSGFPGSTTASIVQTKDPGVFDNGVDSFVVANEEAEHATARTPDRPRTYYSYTVVQWASDNTFCFATRFTTDGTAADQTSSPDFLDAFATANGASHIPVCLLDRGAAGPSEYAAALTFWRQEILPRPTVAS